MQKDIYKEDYFQTLMCVLVDESRKAGSWVDLVPTGIIIETIPQPFIQKLQKLVLPDYRRLAAELIDHFIDSFESQGGDRSQIKEKFERMYIWKK
jgi:hypothetical protein